MWRVVERRLAWIAPIDPVRPDLLISLDKGASEVDLPVMEMARRANPRYLLTPLSRTIPVPLEMSIAPIFAITSSALVHGETIE